MKLYFSPGACSLSPRIVAQEAGLELAFERVDIRSKKLSGDRDFFAINPKGSVPALELDNGEILTEGPAIVQYLADLKPNSGLAPANGTMPRYRLQEMLGFINSEIHKNYSALFSPRAAPEVKNESEATLRKRYAFVETALTGKHYLFGDTFTVADAYLFTVTNWSKFVKLDLSEFPNLLAFQKRVAERPSVIAALTAEGLNK